MQTTVNNSSIINNPELWNIDDRLIDQPGRKFAKGGSPLIDATLEQWGCYQFDSAQTPDSLIEFVDRLVKYLDLSHSKWVSVKDACDRVLHRIEYTEPYFFLVDTLIQLEHDENITTYRHRKTGDVMDPTRMEIFRVRPDWDFKPFKIIDGFLSDKRVEMFLRHNHIPSGFRDRNEALISIYKKMAEVIWGAYEGVEWLVEEMLENFAETTIYDSNLADDPHAREDLHSSIGRDYMFWMGCTLATMIWFKSPRALPFLVRHHVIYAELIDFDDNGRPIINPGTGAEAIIEGANVYTHLQLERIENRAPDTCSSCGTSMHCTKYVNMTALTHNKCSCGEYIDPLDTGDLAMNHFGRRDCQEYVRKYPAKHGYLCQRCMFTRINQMDPDIPCGRATCPATKCPNHQGQWARLRALTQQRTRQLTAPVKS